MAEQLITLCESCAEKFREKYVLNPVCWAQGKTCSWAGCGNSPAMQYEFISRYQVRHPAYPHQPERKDTRARYREPWRER